MASKFNTIVQTLTVVSVVAAGGVLRADEVKHYESGNKQFHAEQE